MDNKQTSEVIEIADQLTATGIPEIITMLNNEN